MSKQYNYFIDILCISKLFKITKINFTLNLKENSTNPRSIKSSLLYKFTKLKLNMLNIIFFPVNHSTKVELKFSCHNNGNSISFLSRISKKQKKKLNRKWFFWSGFFTSTWICLCTRNSTRMLLFPLVLMKIKSYGSSIWYCWFLGASLFVLSNHFHYPYWHYSPIFFSTFL